MEGETIQKEKKKKRKEKKKKEKKRKEKKKPRFNNRPDQTTNVPNTLGGDSFQCQSFSGGNEVGLFPLPPIGDSL